MRENQHLSALNQSPGGDVIGDPLVLSCIHRTLTFKYDNVNWNYRHFITGLEQKVSSGQAEVSPDIPAKPAPAAGYGDGALHWVVAVAVKWKTCSPQLSRIAA